MANRKNLASRRPLREEVFHVNSLGVACLLWHFTDVRGVETLARDVEVSWVDHALDDVVEVGDGGPVEIVLVQHELADGVTAGQGELADPCFTSSAGNPIRPSVYNDPLVGTSQLVFSLKC